MSIQFQPSKNRGANINSIVTGTGCYIPKRKILNRDFLDRTFLDEEGNKFERDNEEIIQKFEAITGIKERRYASDDVLTSDMATSAAQKALKDANADPETIDYIVVAHNFGDVRANKPNVDTVPSLAARVKQQLAIENPYCVAYDLPFGCPGWVQGLIQTYCLINAEEATKILVIGAETLSRISDPHDRDSMIYADGAGAALIEGRKSAQKSGIIAHAARSDVNPQADYLSMGSSNTPQANGNLYMKMEGRKLYEYALTHVPGLIKRSLDKAELSIEDIDKVLVHQANAKMDQAIIERLLKCYDFTTDVDQLMPMTIDKLGNSSVATVPTLYDLCRHDKLNGHHINAGDYLVFASVGAGMNINSVVYKVPT